MEQMEQFKDNIAGDNEKAAETAARFDIMGVPDETTLGLEQRRNTKGSASVKARAWSITLNNYSPEEMEHFKGLMSREGADWGLQEETGAEGTRHLQGWIHYRSPRSFESVRKMFPRAHIEKARNVNALRKYCMKEATRTGACFRKEENPHVFSGGHEIEDPFAGMIPKGWQQEILNIIKIKPDRRTIHWYYDVLGNVGKTTFAAHLCLLAPDNVLYLSNKSADVKHGVAEFLGGGNTLKIAIFDFTRTGEEFVSYEALEAVKNGIFFSGKYESKMIMYNPPHVFVFANFKPDESKLSGDRWKIKDITEYPSEEYKLAMQRGLK